jgi:hypothetical protein
MRNRGGLVLVIVALLTACVLAGCQSAGVAPRPDVQPKPAAVSDAFQIKNMPADRVFELDLSFLKRQDRVIEAAGKDMGQITTALAFSGGWKQTGTRVRVTLIKDSDTETTVKVAVMEQTRWKAIQSEPWGDPVLNPEKSARLAHDIRAFIEGSLNK